MMSQLLQSGGAGTARVVETLTSALLPLATSALWRSSRPSFSQCQAPEPSRIITPSSPGQRTGNAYSSRDEQPQLRYKAVTVDLFGTLLGEAIGEAKVYAMMMRRHGYQADEEEIDRRYRIAYKEQKSSETMRYIGDGKQFWRAVVMEAVDCRDEKVFEDIYGFYELPAAWKVSAGAFPAVHKLRKRGVKTAIISDFDTRLRELVQSYGLDRAFDEIICSAEVGAEKPDPRIFQAACDRLGVKPHEVLHIGDSESRDLRGALDFGMDALLWGRDATSFYEVADMVLNSAPSSLSNSGSKEAAAA